MHSAYPCRPASTINIAQTKPLISPILLEHHTKQKFPPFSPQTRPITRFRAQQPLGDLPPTLSAPPTRTIVCPNRQSANQAIGVIFPLSSGFFIETTISCLGSQSKDSLFWLWELGRSLGFCVPLLLQGRSAVAVSVPRMHNSPTLRDFVVGIGSNALVVVCSFDLCVLIIACM